MDENCKEAGLSGLDWWESSRYLEGVAGSRGVPGEGEQEEKQVWGQRS